MATITRENIAPLNDKLIVHLSKEDYLPAFEKSLKQYAKTANIPGFRKGMVPTGIIKKMHGQGIFAEQVFQAVDKAVNDYVSENKLEIIGQPLPLDQENFSLNVNDPQDYVLNFEIGLQPEINIDPAKINATRYNIQVSDTTLNAEVENAQRKAGEYSNPETVDDEEAIISFDIAIEGPANDSTLAKGNSVITLKDFSTKAADALKGKKIGDTTVFKLGEAFKEEAILNRVYSDLKLDKENQIPAATTATFTITKIGHVNKAELNEAFFKQAYPAKDIIDETAYREELKNDIAAYYEGQSNAQLQDQVYHALVDDTKLDFPEAFLKRWLKATSKEPKTNDDINNDYEAFAKQLQWALISSKLSADNNIQVEPEEIKSFAKNQLLQYMGGQITADANTDWINDYADRMMNDRKFIEDAHGQIRIGKLLSILAGQVNAHEENISEEDFNAKMQSHQH